MVFFNNTLHNNVDAVRGDIINCISTRAEGFADVVLFNPPYVPTSSSEVQHAESSVTATWAGGIDGREVRFFCLIDPLYSIFNLIIPHCVTVNNRFV